MEDKLKNFLNLNWARPENALLLTFKSKCFENIKFESPSLEICCGDGTSMFINLGGVFDSSFNYYNSTRASQFKHSCFIDIHDSIDESYEVNIVRKPDSTIDYGIDWKQALLDKAAKLNLYKNLVLHDINKVPLPFPDDFFKTVYSNSIYHVRNLQNLISDIYRILRPDGIVVLQTMTPYFLETLDQMKKYLSKEAIAILDRKRKETMPGASSFEEWKRLFLNAGFKIESVKSIFPDKVLIDIWNIGLRPIAHLLIQMCEDLPCEKWIKIKQEWVEIFYELCKPLLSLKQTYTLEKAPDLLFVLKKQNK